MTEEFESDAYADAQAAQSLKHQIRGYAEQAAVYGRIDRTWINETLHRMGIDPIQGQNVYQMNIQVTGLLGMTVKAATRAEATEKFQKFAMATLARGVVDGSHCVRVFNPEIVGEDGPQFFSGPEDPDLSGDFPELDLASLKTAIRDMLKVGVTDHGWGHAYAVQALDVMGLEPLPALHHKTVEVPVSGVTRLSVPVFEGDDDAAVQRAAAAKMASVKDVTVHAEEVGEATWARPSVDGATGLHLVDSGEDDVAF